MNLKIEKEETLELENLLMDICSKEKPMNMIKKEK